MCAFPSWSVWPGRWMQVHACGCADSSAPPMPVAIKEHHGAAWSSMEQYKPPRHCYGSPRTAGRARPRQPGSPGLICDPFPSRASPSRRSRRISWCRAMEPISLLGSGGTVRCVVRREAINRDPHAHLRPVLALGRGALTSLMALKHPGSLPPVSCPSIIIMPINA